MFITMVNIAIDGPAGAGKSTVARGAAKALGYIYVDTGALYRTVALYVLQNGHNVHDSERVKAALADIRIELKFVGGVQRVYLNGRDVSEEIRTPEVSMGASAVAALPCVREFLFEQQRRIAREKNCIMDGRDIGTVVLPDAQVKVFLTLPPRSARAGATANCWRRGRTFCLKRCCAMCRSVIITIPTAP